MSERLKEAVLKTVAPQGDGGSNPSLPEKHNRTSASGKPPVFGTGIRRFKSYRPKKRARQVSTDGGWLKVKETFL